MHEMQTIVADDRDVCQSVCLSVTRLNSASLSKRTAERINVPFGVNTLGSTRNTVLGGDPDRQSRKYL